MALPPVHRIGAPPPLHRHRPVELPEEIKVKTRRVARAPFQPPEGLVGLSMEVPSERERRMTVDRLLTAAEVAERLNVSTAWIYEAVGSGRIPHIRLGRSVRFGWPDVEAWLEQIKRPGSAARHDRPGA